MPLFLQLFPAKLARGWGGMQGDDCWGISPRINAFAGSQVSRGELLGVLQQDLISSA